MACANNKAPHYAIPQIAHLLNPLEFECFRLDLTLIQLTDKKVSVAGPYALNGRLCVAVNARSIVQTDAANSDVTPAYSNMSTKFAGGRTAAICRAKQATDKSV
jgi:hypothetical protein